MPSNPRSVSDHMEALYQRAVANNDDALLIRWALARWPLDDWTELQAELKKQKAKTRGTT